MRLFRFDDHTRKPDLSRLNDYSRFLHPRYRGCVLDYLLNEGGGATAHNAATVGDGVAMSGSGAAAGWQSERYYKFASNSLILGGADVATQMAGRAEWSLIFSGYPIAYSASRAAVGLHANGDAAKSFIMYPANSSAAQVRVWFNGSNVITSGFVSTNIFDWHIYAFRSQSTTDHRLFFDGINIGSSSSSVSLDASLNTINFGGWKPGTQTWPGGSMKWARLYTRSLSDREIQSFTEAPYLEYFPQRNWWFVPSAAGTVVGMHRHLPLVGVG